MKKYIILCLAVSVCFAQSRITVDRVSTTNQALNNYIHDVIGNKNDTNAHGSLMGMTKDAITRITDVTNSLSTVGAEMIITTNSLATRETEMIIVTNSLSTVEAELVLATNSLRVLEDAVAVDVFYSGVYEYTNAAGAQALFTLDEPGTYFVHGIMVDAALAVSNGTLAYRTKIDGTNARAVTTASFAYDTQDAIMLQVDMLVTNWFEFTWTEADNMGAPVDLYYNVSYEIR